MSTLPLPTVDPRPARPGRGVGALEMMSGLAGGGLLLLGVVLLALQLVAPQVISDADGPGWVPVLAHLLVGGAAETGRGLRRRMPVAVRAAVAGASIAAVLAVVIFVWWR